MVEQAQAHRALRAILLQEVKREPSFLSREKYSSFLMDDTNTVTSGKHSPTISFDDMLEKCNSQQKAHQTPG